MLHKMETGTFPINWTGVFFHSWDLSSQFKPETYEGLKRIILSRVLENRFLNIQLFFKY